MKTNKIYMGLCAAICWLLSACAEDKGNYNYIQINEVTIDNIRASYSCEAGGRLYISPDIKSLDEATADLSYSWSIKNEEISTDKILDVTLPPLDYGEQLAALTVTDNVTKMQYRKTFNLNIVNSFNWGYYFLTRKDDGSTEMAYIQATQDVEPTMEDVKYATGCGDYEFGNEPSQLLASLTYINSLRTHYWTFTILTQEGNYRAINTNNATFTASSLVTEESFSDQSAGYQFKPTQAVSSPDGSLYFISESKFIKYVKAKNEEIGLLYRPAKYDKEYKWSHAGFPARYPNFCWIYDELTHKYYVIMANTTSDPATGVYADENAYDKVVEIVDNVEIKGDIIYTSVSDFARFDAYSIDAEGIHSYTFDYDRTNYNFLKEAVVPFDGASKRLAFVIGVGRAANHWYVGSGNLIHYSSIEESRLNVWKELPSDLGLGTIEKIGFSARGDRMVVVLYDENSPEERKGSVIFIDTDTKEITHKFPHILHHCVDYGGCNSTTNSNYGDTGDLK